MVLVKFYHSRDVREIGQAIDYARREGVPCPIFSPKVVTTCLIFYDIGMKRYLSLGHAFCSQKDNFCKKTGRNIALARAAKKAGFKVKWDKKKKELFLDEK